MKKYFDMLNYVLENGEREENRTGIDTLAVTGYMFEHDMSEGFPLLTSKKMGLKTIGTELEFFLHGMSSKQWLKDRKCNIWNEWTNPQKVPYANDEETKAKMAAEDDLGKIYGYQWVCFEPDSLSIVEVPKKVKELENPISYPLYPIKSVEQDPNDENIGKVFDTKSYGKVQITKYNSIDEDNHKYYTIQFIETGSYKENVRLDYIRSGQIKDSYKQLSHTGYRGNENYIDHFIKMYGETIYTKALKCWNHMMERCYNSNCKQYHLYGGKGIFVENRWHDFSLFLQDIPQLSNWPTLLRDPSLFDLDKDYYESNCYSKDTCIWLTHRNNLVNIQSKAFNAINIETNEKTLYISIHDCSEALNINRTSIQKCLNGEFTSCKGYKFEYLNDGKIYRYKQAVNQLQNVIDTIKKDPTSRRLIVSAWNPLQLDQMALPPCHIGFELLAHPKTKKLDLIFAMRSVDLGLGFPYDIASYGLLLTLIAKETGYTPGKLVAMLGNTHIYVNQIDKLKEQLQRPTHDLPTIDFKKWDGIWNWEATDTIVNNYVSEASLKMDVAV